MLRLFSKFKFVTMLLLLIGSLSMPLLATAQDGTRVFLQPTSTAGDTVTVDVVAENVAELYGVEFLLTYDPAAVEIIDMNPDQDGVQMNAGTLLPAEQGFVVANQARSQAGTISFAMTLLNPAPAVSGTGTLAQFNLKKLQNAPTTIDIADVKLVAVSLQIIPAQTSGLTLNAAGEGATAAAPAMAADDGSSFPWWMVAVGIIVLGLISLGAFLVLGNLSGTAPATTTAATVAPAAQRPARSRPSAFK